MRRLAPTLLVIGVYCTVLALRVGEAGGPAAASAGAQQTAPSVQSRTDATAATDSTAIIEKHCLTCHDDTRKRGGLTLANFDVATAEQHAEIAEKMIGKLRVGLMPPKSARRLDPAARMALIAALEAKLDGAAAR